MICSKEVVMIELTDDKRAELEARINTRGFDRLPQGQYDYRDRIGHERVPDLLERCATDFDLSTLQEAAQYIYELEEAIIDLRNW
jgi:CBS domain containing-hemolysin-like protein